MKTRSPLWIRLTALITALIIVFPGGYLAMAVTPPAANSNAVYLDLFAQGKGKNFLEWLAAFDGAGEGGFMTHCKTDKFGRPTRALSASVFSTKQEWWMRVDFNKQALPSRIIDSNGYEVLFSKYRGVGKADPAGDPFPITTATGNAGVSGEATVKVTVRDQNKNILHIARVAIPLIVLTMSLFLRDGIGLFAYMQGQSVGSYSSILPTGLSPNQALFAITGKMFGVLMIGALLASTYFVTPAILGGTLGNTSIIPYLIGLALVNGPGTGLDFLTKFIALLYLSSGDFSSLLGFMLGGTILLAGGAGGFWQGYAPHTCYIYGLLALFSQKPVRQNIPLMMRTAITVLCLFTFWAFPSA